MIHPGIEYRTPGGGDQLGAGQSMASRIHQAQLDLPEGGAAGMMAGLRSVEAMLHLQTKEVAAGLAQECSVLELFVLGCMLQG